MKLPQTLTSFIFIAGLGACFPEASYEWEEATDDAPEAQNPFGDPQEPALTQSTSLALVEGCPSTVQGLASDLAGIVPGGRLGIGSQEIRGLSDEPFLESSFALQVALTARDRPMAVGCVEEALAGGVLQAGTGEESVGALIRHAADILSDGAWEQDSPGDRGDLEAATMAICRRFLPEPTIDPETAESVPPDPALVACGPAQGVLPSDLEEALSPVMWAIHDGVVVRRSRDAQLVSRDADWWRDHGGKGLLASKDGEGYNVSFDEDRSFLSASRGELYGAAAAIADAVQAVNWEVFRGRNGVRYDFETPAGWIRVRGAESDEYLPTSEGTLLLVDLGGDDVHLDEVASNLSGDNAVSVVVDLGGDDTYTYPGAESPALDAGRLPLDGAGRVTVPTQVEGGSASEAGRQGSARNGIALLFDLGGSRDTYAALRGSQGYAHQGVGVLFDDGGEDRYFAEDASQGAGQFGIGLLIDLGQNDDVRRSSHASQGFGYVAGVGVLFDAGGADTYDCHPDHDGAPAYPAPQRVATNGSMCQGAGLGFRPVPKDAVYSLPGGIGLLIDAGGTDSYRGGVYAQGVGYWQGFGLLSDRRGEDRYDAYYYSQGAGVHFGTGFLADGGQEADTFGSRLLADAFVLGAAQDFSVGVFVNEGGDDTYRLPHMSGGAASCGSVTLFIENGGADAYDVVVSNAGGAANTNSCGPNTNVVSTAVFVDVGGNDAWSDPTSRHQNDADWQAVAGSGVDARVFGRDVSSGESGVHVGPR